MSDITIWNLLEGELGILAASVPYLKSTFDNVLKRFGILKINDEIQGATSVRVADYDYESELEAFRRQSQMNASSGDKLDIQVGQIIPDTDTEVSSVPSQSPGKDLGLQNNV